MIPIEVKSGEEEEDEVYEEFNGDAQSRSVGNSEEVVKKPTESTEKYLFRVEPDPAGAADHRLGFKSNINLSKDDEDEGDEDASPAMKWIRPIRTR